MASRKLVRDFLLSKQMSVHLRPQQAPLNPQLRTVCLNGYLNLRRFSVFNEFSKKVKGEASSNQEFQQSMKELKEKAEEKAEALKEVKEDLKIRTKQTTEQLYKQVDGVWTEAEAAAKKVSADMKEKIAAATEEVKEKFGLGKQDSPDSTCGSTDSGADVKDGNHAASASESSESSESCNAKEATGASDTLFGRFKSGFSSSSPKVSLAFQKFKDTKVLDFAKKGYDIVKDELSSNPNRRRRIKYADAAAAAAAASPKEGTSNRKDMVVVPTKQSRWGKKWEALKEKMQGHPLFKRLSGYSEPVVTKGQELAEDVRERWETSDSPVVHKIQEWINNAL
ncbi:hypothetical protein ACLOJK_019856 [Asimina triloba]